MLSLVCGVKGDADNDDDAELQLDGDGGFQLDVDTRSVSADKEVAASFLVPREAVSSSVLPVQTTTGASLDEAKA